MYGVHQTRLTFQKLIPYACLNQEKKLEKSCDASYVRLGVATNHLPSKPSPFVWPAAVSPEKMYKRCPLYSTWFPLAVVTAVSCPGSEVALVGAAEPVDSSGGQAFAHALVQAEVVAVSDVR